VFGSSDPGICHVELRYEDGSSFAADVTFTAEWLPCGSDPHGCGEFIHSTGLQSDSAGHAVRVAGLPCAERGVTVTPFDATAE
jgi:hypothetical protein